jgi:DNA-binding transcriptional ArsR family regulator
VPEDVSISFNALDRAFHEPNRLQILSILAAAPQGLAFGELKTKTGLTDGNLSRHVKTLETAGAVRVEKSFVGVKPRTTLVLSDEGRQRLLTYLDHLEKVLTTAKSLSTKPVAPPETPEAAA